VNTSEAEINRRVLVLAGHLIRDVWDGMWITCQLVNIMFYSLKETKYLTHFSYLLTRHYRKLPNITSKIKANVVFCNRTLRNLFETPRAVQWKCYFSYRLNFISNCVCPTKLSWYVIAYYCKNRKVLISITIIWLCTVIKPLITAKIHSFISQYFKWPRYY
jgi:hypothetical protein